MYTIETSLPKISHHLYLCNNMDSAPQPAVQVAHMSYGSQVFPMYTPTKLNAYKHITLECVVTLN